MAARAGVWAASACLPAPHFPHPSCPARGWQLDAAAMTTIPNKTIPKTPREEESSSTAQSWHPAGTASSGQHQEQRGPSPQCSGMLPLANALMEAGRAPCSAPRTFRLRSGLAARALAAAPLIRGAGSGERQVKREQRWSSGVPAPSLTPPEQDGGVLVSWFQSKELLWQGPRRRLGARLEGKAATAGICPRKLRGRPSHQAPRIVMQMHPQPGQREAKLQPPTPWGPARLEKEELKANS